MSLRLSPLAEDPEGFAELPFRTDGLIGNAGLWDRVAVLDLGLVPQFGVMRWQRGARVPLRDRARRRL